MTRITVALFSILSFTVFSFAGKEVKIDHIKKIKVYPNTVKEAYMSAEELQWIRPGYQIQILGVTIPDDLKPEVEFKIVDDLNQPLDRAGIQTLGTCSLSFILAVYDGATRDFTAYTARTVTSSITNMVATQASTDSGGTFTDLEIGHGIYKFGTTLPADYDGSKTHTLAVYGDRILSPYVDREYNCNVTYDWVPDGSPVVDSYNATVSEACNGCHHELAMHGGHRRDVKLCTTCHSPQSTDPDTGNTVDMAVMIHKIHMGENLPSVENGTPYQIIGYRNSVHDYSDVALPMDIRNCTKCHVGSENWLFHPTRNACGSCHDDVNFETGENHWGGIQVDDSKCSFCHIPDSGKDFGASVKGAHVIPENSQLLEGLHADIINVVDTAPGMNPTVTFKLTDDAGHAIDPASLDRLNLLLAGPTTDYATYMSESATGAAFDGTTATYTFAGMIPEDTTGTWTASADVYRFVNIATGTDTTARVREAAQNPLFNFAVTDTGPVARREVVDMNKCNVCHARLALHGGQRMVIGECVMCHNANMDDAEVRPEDQFPAQTIHFKWMIHRIHSGEELMNDFTVYGYHSSVNNYNDVVYPGLLNNCEACHMPGTYTPPLPETALPTTTNYEIYSPMMPEAAACLSCHDSETTAIHAYVNTAPFGESCATCHGEGRDFSVEKVHAQ